MASNRRGAAETYWFVAACLSFTAWLAFSHAPSGLLRTLAGYLP